MPALPPVAQPGRRIFDPWNSSSTGHQYAENRLGSSTSWRDSRSAKLATQFGDQSRGGGERLYDTAGAGALGFGKDGRRESGAWNAATVRGARGKAGLRAGEVGKTGDLGAWLKGEKEGLKGGVVKELKREREEEEMIIREREDKKRKLVASEQTRMEVQAQTRQFKESKQHWTEEEFSLDDLPEELRRPTTAKSVASIREDDARLKSEEDTQLLDDEATVGQRDPLSDATETSILKNCIFYINGSTMPMISDHRLKFLIAQHGGLTSIALGRRTVTHVLVGTPNDKGGVGGGLAGGKIQKELDKIRGKGIKFIGVDWLLESIKAGKRLPEARFADSSLLLAPTGVNSVYGMFKQTKPNTWRDTKRLPGRKGTEDG